MDVRIIVRAFRKVGMDEYWHCARCQRRSGMYGHSGPEGWYCDKVEGFEDGHRTLCEQFDETMRVRRERIVSGGLQ